MRVKSFIFVLAILVGFSSDGFAAAPFGVNTGWDWVDLTKGIGGWRSPTNGPAPAIDANGWPEGDAQAVFLDERRNMPWRAPDAPAIDENLSGTYHISFTGQATITGTTEVTTGILVQHQQYDPGTNTTTAEIVLTPSHWLMILSFTNTKRMPGDAPGTGFTNLRVIRPGYAADTTQVFTNGSLLANRAPFSALRFLGQDAANSYQNFYGTTLVTTKWADRVQVTDAYQGGLPQNNTNLKQSRGDAWEYMIMLANAGNHDMWINIPESADDDYVTQLATLIKNGNQYTPGLKPGLHVYVEFSNEVWNYGFQQATYNTIIARQEGISNDQRYIERTIQIAQLFANVFGQGALNTTIRPVALWQYTQELTFFRDLAWAEQRFGEPVKNFLYGIGEAPYYGPTDTSTVDNIFNTMWTGSDSTRRDFIGWEAVAAYYGLKEVGYEAGPSLVGGTGAYATRDPRMVRSEVHHFLDNWFAVGGDEVNFFALKGAVSQFGDWLLVEDFEHLITPKSIGAGAILAAPQPKLTAGYVLPWATGQTATIDPSQRTPDAFTNEAKPGSGLTIRPNSNSGYGSSFVYLLRSGVSGTYAISLYGHATASDAQLQISVDDRVVGTVILPATDGLSQPVPVTLGPGFHSLSLAEPSNISGSSVFPAGTGAIQIALTAGGGAGTVPSAPANLTATVNDSTASLLWAPASTATSYNVKRSTSSGGPYQSVGTVATNSYTDTGLTNGTTYYYVVTAVNSAGEGAVSPQIPVVPTPPSAPDVPNGLSAQVGGGDSTPFFGSGIAILSWDPVANAVSYNVKRADSASGPFKTISNQLGTSYTDMGINNGSTYYYVVSAVNSFGESADSPVITASPVETVRTPPQIYKAENVDGSVFLAWNPDPLTTPQFGTAFNVKRSDTPGGPYTTIVQINTYNAFDYTAQPGKTYYYVVTATNSKGESANSNEVSVTASGGSPGSASDSQPAFPAP